MNRALLVIDVQESFRARDSWAEFSDPDIVGPVHQLVDAARAAGDLVVWIRHAEPGTGNVFDPEQGFVRLMDGLEPRSGEPQIVKTSVNSFTTTNLQQTLTQHGVSEVVICGIRTEQCCETTARLASDLGYEVTFVVDATTTSPAGDLSAAEIIARTATVLAEREFATVTTVSAFLGRTAAVGLSR